jgi:predicted metalloendopeptidase
MRSLVVLLASIAVMTCCVRDVVAQTQEALREAAIDPSIAACDDFYKHATSAWIARNPIPPELPTWGVGNIMARNTRETLRSILAQAPRSHDPGERAAGAYYASCMDTATIEARGLTPLRAELQRIDAVRTANDAGRVLMQLQIIGTGAAFIVRTESEREDATRILPAFHPPEFGLSRGDYSAATSRGRELRDAYRDYIARLLAASGIAQGEALDDARAILALETKLAGATLTLGQRRDLSATDHRMSFDDVKRTTPHLPWNAMFASLNLPAPARVDLSQPRYFAALESALVDAPAVVWRAYLRYLLLDSYAPTLPKVFDDAYFAFHTTAHTGVVQRKPRWRDCTAAVEADLGTTLGRAYARRALTTRDRDRVATMADNIAAAYREMIVEASWMSEPTKQRALQKLARIRWELGGPRTPSDDLFDVGSGAYAAVARRVALQWSARRFNTANTSARPGRWTLSPAQPNARLDSPSLTMYVTAADLQPPLFDAAADDAWNYGAIGAEIGHEFAHAFDDRGSHFDQNGAVANWWSDSDRAAFEARIACVKKRLAMYEFAGQRLDPDAVIGEVIADRAGVKAAFRAYMKSLEVTGRRTIGGLTPEQRFFLAYAQMWTRHSRAAFEADSMKDDNHPPDAIRVREALAGLPTFEAAFGCTQPPACDVW